MTDPARVVVVMSCYNDESCVEAAVHSIQQQTFRNWELIVIDDGSEDNTFQVLSDLAADDRRIRIVTQQNTGLTQALINGCQLAESEYIARLDADDVSMPTRLEKQVRLLDTNPGIGFVSSWAEAVGPAGEFLEIYQRTEDVDAATADILEFRLGPPAHGTVMFRSSLYQQVGGYRAEFLYGQDSDLWARMADQSRISYVPEVLYRFARDPRSISGNRRTTQREFGLLEHACSLARRAGESEGPALSRAQKLATDIRAGRVSPTGSTSNMAYLIASQLVQNKDVRARRYLGDVLRQNPWHWKAWVRLGQSFITGRQPEAAGKESP